MIDKENVALITSQAKKRNKDKENLREQMALHFKSFNKFKSKYFRRYQGESSKKPSGRSRKKDEMLCHNCRKPGHFATDYPHPRAKKYYDDEKVSRSAEKHKARKSLKAKEVEEDDTSSSEQSSSSSSGDEAKCLIVMEEDKEVISGSNSFTSSSSTFADVNMKEMLEELESKFREI